MQHDLCKNGYKRNTRYTSCPCCCTSLHHPLHSFSGQKLHLFHSTIRVTRNSNNSTTTCLTSDYRISLRSQALHIFYSTAQQEENTALSYSDADASTTMLRASTSPLVPPAQYKAAPSVKTSLPRHGGRFFFPPPFCCFKLAHEVMDPIAGCCPLQKAHSKAKPVAVGRAGW